MTSQPVRRPKGAPASTGGQFASRANADSNVSLGSGPKLTTPEWNDLLAIAEARVQIEYRPDRGDDYPFRGAHLSTPATASLLEGGWVEAVDGSSAYGGPALHLKLTERGRAALQSHPPQAPKVPRAIRILARAAHETLLYMPGEPGRSAAWLSSGRARSADVDRLIEDGLLEQTQPGWWSASESATRVLDEHPDARDEAKAHAMAKSTHSPSYDQYSRGGRSWGRGGTYRGTRVTCSCGWTRRANEGKRGAVIMFDAHLADARTSELMRLQRERRP